MILIFCLRDSFQIFPDSQVLRAAALALSASDTVSGTAICPDKVGIPNDAATAAAIQLQIIVKGETFWNRNMFRTAIREFPQEFRFAIDFGEYNGIPPHIRELTESLREILPAHLALDYLFVYTAEEAVKAAFTAFSETMPRLEVWPRSLRSVEITKAVSPVAATEHHSRVEIYPAEQEET